MLGKRGRDGDEKGDVDVDENSSKKAKGGTERKIQSSRRGQTFVIKAPSRASSRPRQRTKRFTDEELVMDEALDEHWQHPSPDTSASGSSAANKSSSSQGQVYQPVDPRYAAKLPTNPSMHGPALGNLSQPAPDPNDLLEAHNLVPNMDHEGPAPPPNGTPGYYPKGGPTPQSTRNYWCNCFEVCRRGRWLTLGSWAQHAPRRRATRPPTTGPYAKDAAKRQTMSASQLAKVSNSPHKGGAASPWPAVAATSAAPKKRSPDDIDDPARSGRLSDGSKKTPEPIELPAGFVYPPLKQTSRKAPDGKSPFLPSTEEEFYEDWKEHCTLNGIKMKEAPMSGGSVIHISQLWEQVDQRGGVDAVTNDKRWSEVYGHFNISPTITSAGFTFRKHYTQLLVDYERAKYGDSRTYKHAVAGESITTAHLEATHKAYRKRPNGEGGTGGGSSSTSGTTSGTSSGGGAISSGSKVVTANGLPMMKSSLPLPPGTSVEFRPSAALPATGPDSKESTSLMLRTLRMRAGGKARTEEAEAMSNTLWPADERLPAIGWIRADPAALDAAASLSLAARAAPAYLNTVASHPSAHGFRTHIRTLLKAAGKIFLTPQRQRGLEGGEGEEEGDGSHSWRGVSATLVEEVEAIRRLFLYEGNAVIGGLFGAFPYLEALMDELNVWCTPEHRLMPMLWRDNWALWARKAMEEAEVMVWKTWPTLLERAFLMEQAEAATRLTNGQLLPGPSDSFLEWLDVGLRLDVSGMMVPFTAPSLNVLAATTLRSMFAAGPSLVLFERIMVFTPESLKADTTKEILKWTRAVVQRVMDTAGPGVVSDDFTAAAETLVTGTLVYSKEETDVKDCLEVLRVSPSCLFTRRMVESLANRAPMAAAALAESHVTSALVNLTKVLGQRAFFSQDMVNSYEEFKDVLANHPPPAQPDGLNLVIPTIAEVGKMPGNEYRSTAFWKKLLGSLAIEGTEWLRRGDKSVRGYTTEDFSLRPWTGVPNYLAGIRGWLVVILRAMLNHRFAYRDLVGASDHASLRLGGAGGGSALNAGASGKAGLGVGAARKNEVAEFPEDGDDEAEIERKRRRAPESDWGSRSLKMPEEGNLEMFQTSVDKVLDEVRRQVKEAGMLHVWEVWALLAREVSPGCLFAGLPRVEGEEWPEWYGLACLCDGLVGGSLAQRLWELSSDPSLVRANTLDELAYNL